MSTCSYNNVCKFASHPSCPWIFLVEYTWSNTHKTLQLFWCLFLLCFSTHWIQSRTSMCLQTHLILSPQLWVMDWDRKACMVSADTSSVTSWYRISPPQQGLHVYSLSMWCNLTVKKLENKRIDRKKNTYNLEPKRYPLLKWWHVLSIIFLPKTHTLTYAHTPTFVLCDQESIIYTKL